jgi:hypothetical protein
MLELLAQNAINFGRVTLAQCVAKRVILERDGRVYSVLAAKRGELILCHGVYPGNSATSRD